MKQSGLGSLNRRLTSLLIALVFLVLTVTAVLAFIRPFSITVVGLHALTGFLFTILALFHIGNGSWNGGGPPQPCHHGHQAGSDLPVDLGNASGSTLHIADSPAGPWRPAPPPPPCSNPAPFLHSNGTWFLFCDGPFMWRASDVRGPWAPVEMHVPPMNCVGDCAGVQGAYEDPVLFIDTRARWVSTTACKRPVSVGCVSHTGGAVAAHPVARLQFHRAVRLLPAGKCPAERP